MKKEKLFGSDFEIQKIFSHPKYDGNAAYFDVGIIKTKTKILFNQLIRPICLPDHAEPSYDTYKEKSTLLVGKKSPKYLSNNHRC